MKLNDVIVKEKLNSKNDENCFYCNCELNSTNKQNINDDDDDDYITQKTTLQNNLNSFRIKSASNTLHSTKSILSTKKIHNNKFLISPSLISSSSSLKINLKDDENLNTNYNSTLNDTYYIKKLLQNFKLMNNLLNGKETKKIFLQDNNRRTINLQRKTLNISFGFELQCYGLFNHLIKRIEYVFYVNKVELNSIANLNGLKVGDVLLAVDGFKVNEFKNLFSLLKYAKERKSIRLVVVQEYLTKKIDYQKRIFELEKLITDKREEYDRLCVKEQYILEKAKKRSKSEPPLRKEHVSVTTINPNGSYKQTFLVQQDDEPSISTTITIKSTNTASSIFSNESTPSSSRSLLFSPSNFKHIIDNYQELDSCDESEWIVTRL